MSYREKIYAKYAEGFQNGAYQLPDLGSRWARAYKYFFRGWLPEAKNAAIVDVGCGGGQLLAVFKSFGYQNLGGVDISEQQVSLALSAGFKVEVGDVISFLKNHPDQFDLVTAVDILEHLTKDEVMDFLQNAYQSLRRGGRLILQMPNPDSPMGMKIRYGDFTHEVCLSPDCAVRLLKLFGFRDCCPRETGPVPGLRSLPGTLRWIAWRTIRIAFLAYDLIEAGSAYPGIYTRVFLISARKVS